MKWSFCIENLFKICYIIGYLVPDPEVVVKKLALITGFVFVGLAAAFYGTYRLLQLASEE